MRSKGKGFKLLIHLTQKMSCHYDVITKRFQNAWSRCKILFHFFHAYTKCVLYFVSQKNLPQKQNFLIVRLICWCNVDIFLYNLCNIIDVLSKMLIEHFAANKRVLFHLTFKLLSFHCLETAEILWLETVWLRINVVINSWSG